MKLLCAALCACALSACAVDEPDELETTTQEAKAVPPFYVTMGTGGDCSILNLIANWTAPQVGQDSVEYTVSDVTNGTGFSITAFVSPSDTTNLTTVGFLDALTKGGHRFRVDGRLLRSDGFPIVVNGFFYEDSFKTRLPCVLPMQ